MGENPVPRHLWDVIWRVVRGKVSCVLSIVFTNGVVTEATIAEPVALGDPKEPS